MTRNLTTPATVASTARAPRLKVLICGGGCAGPALAFWLARNGHRATVVERFPALRATGAQVDLRGQGIEAVERMGLLDVIRARLVDEAGVSFVDNEGVVRGTVLANRSGRGAQSLTSEYEIMRGDIVRILHDATKDDVEYVFDKAVDSFAQDEREVTAHFSDGTVDTFDLLVGADGQGSRIRKSILPPGSAEPYWRMGMHMAYWFIPRASGDSNMRQTFNAPNGRMIFRRSHSPTETQVYFVLRDSSHEASRIHREPLEQQKQFWADRFRDAGWQTARFVDGMMTTSNFYSQEVVQVRTGTWFQDRVVLVGDAAHCSSPFSGMGVSGSLVGAYVLAGELSRRAGDLPKALASYESVLRPFVNEIQDVNVSLLRLGMPRTRWGIRVLHAATAAACRLRIPDLVARLSAHDRDGGWCLPTYPELPSRGVFDVHA
jgi:2-polyprenyl-6-methoxyphenol hydroxylase-like FAD-dependent oxidoreductase